MQFIERDICGLLEEALSESGAKPGALVLELTESVFADSTGQMVTTLTRLREMGVGLSIDDFGTGYSSLRYLEAFPISEVKLDRVFIHALHQSRTRQVIVDGMIKLGLELDIDVVAEGIETEEELSILRKLGCALGQGYLFGAPVPEDEFLELIKKGSKTVSNSGSTPGARGSSDTRS